MRKKNEAFSESTRSDEKNREETRGEKTIINLEQRT